jgi:plasmid maintenance system antidote protein VapI
LDKKYGEYRNLKAELTRSGVTQNQVAEHLGMTVKSLNRRINGFTPFTLPEMVEIRKAFTPDATLDYLSIAD